MPQLSPDNLVLDSLPFGAVTDHQKPNLRAWSHRFRYVEEKIHSLGSPQVPSKEADKLPIETQGSPCRVPV
jgi:hypothetical protein